MSFARRLLPLTIMGLGLAAAFGTQAYLQLYMGDLPSILAAGSIEAAYITLALIRAEDQIRDQILSTARALVWASIIFNFGHAYNAAVPGGLHTETARFEWIAFVQALGIAFFVPWIAYRLSAVQGTLQSVSVSVPAPVTDQIMTHEPVQNLDSEMELVLDLPKPAYVKRGNDLRDNDQTLASTQVPAQDPDAVARLRQSK